MKYFFTFILFIHGLIHLMGFVKAYSHAHISQLIKLISKPSGLVWLATAILLSVAAIMLLLEKTNWPMVAVVSVIISQVLIFTVWKDAKFGTIANVIVLIGATLSWGCINFHAQFRKDVEVNLENKGQKYLMLKSRSTLNQLHHFFL